MLVNWHTIGAFANLTGNDRLPSARRTAV